MTEEKPTIKVIGAGLGRTGTLSLKAALEELGFSRCYHMTDVFAHLEHARVWDDAARGLPVDWDTLFQGYQATVDWPGCAFYEEFMRRYPDAKVILSVRDPERWYEARTRPSSTAQRLSELDEVRRPTDAALYPHDRSDRLDGSFSRKI